MMLCAVFLAIFLPAALVAEGCFRLEFEVVVGAGAGTVAAAGVLLEDEGAPADVANEVPGGT